MAKWLTLYFQLFTSKCKAGGIPSMDWHPTQGLRGEGQWKYMYMYVQCYNTGLMQTQCFRQKILLEGQSATEDLF